MFDNIAKKGPVPSGLPEEPKVTSSPDQARASRPGGFGSGPNAAAEDIFSETDEFKSGKHVAKPRLLHELRAESAQAAGQAASLVSAPGLVSQSQAAHQGPISLESMPNKIKFSVIGTVALLVLVGGGVLAWYLTSRGSTTGGAVQINQQPSNTQNQNIPNVIINTNSEANNENNVPNENSNSQDNTYSPDLSTTPVVEKDSDNDGLTDAEEQNFGTNPAQADTDLDGLIDRDEVRIYSTDPLDPDTDGDGFLDGDEIRNGYNPRGPGKLLQIPQE